MIRLLKIDQDEWDEIVESFPSSDVYYLRGYVKTFHLHGDGDPVLIYYKDEKGGQAICVLMLRDISKSIFFNNELDANTYFDAITPYGYGGFITDGNPEINNLSKEFSKLLQEHNIISVFFRFHPILNNSQDHIDMMKVIPLGKTIGIDLSSPAVIWNNLTSKNRNMIRKAEKSDVKICHSSDSSLITTFKEIYDETMRSDNAEEYYFFDWDFYDSILSDLKGKFEIFYATLHGKIISMAIMIFYKDQMHYHLSGSLREYRSFAPSNLLLYTAALWGHEHGFKTFHLGGGVGAGEDPLFKFKSAFNRNSNYNFSIGKMVVNQSYYDDLMRLRGFGKEESESIGFFPQYRANLIKEH